MKIRHVQFLKSCAAASQFPKLQCPEIAFLGRSNVGKSSLINMLMNKHDLVKTGARPGVTKTVNFFVMNEAISIADLPGFGYAKLPAEIKKKFLPLIRDYINKRENLKLMFLLVDIRRSPDRFEEDLLSLLAKRKVPTAITLTKCDKLSRNQREKRITAISEELGIDRSAFFLSSARTGLGRKELVALIASQTADSEGSRR